ncbi:MAG: hypothetical protein JW841_05070 [Deltaproteobacteria bacterium]|nr:hypothetical protein [Deltaproteobacteria bacterium]
MIILIFGLLTALGLEHWQRVKITKEYNQQNINAAMSLLNWSLLQAEPRLKNCINYRTVPYVVPRIHIKVIIFAEKILSVNISPRNGLLTNSTRDCIKKNIININMPGIGFTTPIVLEKNIEIPFDDVLTMPQ